MTEPRYHNVHVDTLPEHVDDVSAKLFDLGAQGIEERDETTLEKNEAHGTITMVANFATHAEAMNAIADLPPSMAARYHEVVGDAWRDAWKIHYKPHALTHRIIVRPPWEPYEAKAGEKVLVLEPGRAFGTGLHETTRLVAQAIEEHEKELAGVTVLDVGCGSGILALVALELGAHRAICIDCDPDAISVTRENAARNGLEQRVEAATTPIEQVATRSPFVLANIEARALIAMAGDLKSRVAPGGLLLLSGILASQQDDVLAAYADMMPEMPKAAGEWILLALRQPMGP
ncbi:MAG: 50S ribosomal protein L11 methyltransferase [Polyangiaceae bacterium]|nr:50S ribosomal protein L11 methyltransferase [Polyangiaceae bacterium]